MPRVLLLLPTATYGAADFLAAARALDVEVVVGSEELPPLAATRGDGAVVVPLSLAARVAQHVRDRGFRRSRIGTSAFRLDQPSTP